MKKLILLSACFLFCVVSLSHAEQVPGFQTEPYLQNLTHGSAAIMWHSEKPAYGWIEYGKTDMFGEKADMVVDGLRNANVTLHKIRLTELEPGSIYYYRACFKPITKFMPYNVVFDDVVYSKTYTFKTIPTDSHQISCAIFNDLHNNYAMFDSLCAALEGMDYQFSIFNGDCFSDPQSEKDVIEALNIFNDGVSAYSQPPIFIRGNHETRGAFARNLKKSFDFPGDEFYFAITAGPVRFIFLDCGEDKTDDHKEYSGLTDFTGYRERQQKWLKAEVKSNAFRDAKYRILVHHIPLYNHNNRGISKFSRALWASVLDEAPIDIAINGHTHRYGFIPVNADGNNYAALIGGGSKNGTVMLLSASDEKLTIEVLNTSGEIVDRYVKLENEEFKVVH
ncbi:MAG: hypothetical protein HOC71_03615 [Candidatus Latescibacteria bacterium]|jgi:hypothetical protein|nr:hypothetical protein [Candidatus Latescibacterota bacterium]